MKTIYKYTSEDAIEDGILRGNPRADCFDECTIITTALHEELNKVAYRRSEKMMFGEEVLQTIGHLMKFAKDMYDNEKFEGDNDKNFFVVPKGWKMYCDIWFVRNEEGKLTAMLPSDY